MMKGRLFMVDAIQSFNEIRYVTKDGEHISATKNNGVVTLVGDKNGVRQMPLSVFMEQELVNNVQNINLERTPQKDVTSFQGRESRKAYRNAPTKKGTQALGIVSFGCMLPALGASYGVAEKFLEKCKPAQKAISVLGLVGIIGTAISLIKASIDKKEYVKTHNLA